MPNRHSSDAPMSPHELRALRYLWRGLPELVEEAHGTLLVRMGLAKINSGGTLEITDDGTQRFEVERHRSPYTTHSESQSESRAAPSRLL